MSILTYQCLLYSKHLINKTKNNNKDFQTQLDESGIPTL